MRSKIFRSGQLMEYGDVGRMEYLPARCVAHLSAFEILVHFMGLGREDFLDPIQFCLQIDSGRACSTYCCYIWSTQE